jgi:hypothetical protein
VRTHPSVRSRHTSRRVFVKRIDLGAARTSLRFQGRQDRSFTLSSPAPVGILPEDRPYPGAFSRARLKVAGFPPEEHQKRPRAGGAGQSGPASRGSGKLACKPHGLSVAVLLGTLPRVAETRPPTTERIRGQVRDRPT